MGERATCATCGREGVPVTRRGRLRKHYVPNGITRGPLCPSMQPQRPTVRHMVGGKTGEAACSATSGGEVFAAGRALDTARPVAALADPSSRCLAPTPEPP